MLNKFEFGKIKETNGIAALMFFLFAVSVSWILVNVLLTIIIDGYEAVKSELEGRKNDLEVIQYIKVKKCQLGIIDVQTNSESKKNIYLYQGLLPEYGWIPRETTLLVGVCSWRIKT